MTPTRTTIRRISWIATAPSCMDRHFGLGFLRTPSLLLRVSVTPEALLNGRRIEEFFSPDFFNSEFWLLWSTIMGSLPQHSVIEFRRYMNRFLYLFPHLSTMAGVMRTPFNQNEVFVKPLVAWLTPQKRKLRDRRSGQRHWVRTRTQPHHRQQAGITKRMAAHDLSHSRAGGHRSRDHRVAGRRSFRGNDGHGAEATPPETRVSPGPLGVASPRGAKISAIRPSISAPLTSSPIRNGWRSQSPQRAQSSSNGVTKLLGGVEPGCGGLQTLGDSGWVISVSIFHQRPEVLESA